MVKNRRVLLSIPFAGGNKFSFNKFNRYLKDDFDIQHLELPGRGDRISEQLIYDIHEAIYDLYDQIKYKIDSEYVIYGHSLGGILGYLLILMIEKMGMRKPSKFIVSGKANPQMKPTCIRYSLPKDRFIQSIKKLGGMPKEFFDYPELFDFFEPILRADFEMYEKFNFNEDKKIYTKISVLYGERESFSVDEALKWRDFSYQDIDFHRFKGGHFFIFDDIEKICEIIK